MIKKRTQHINIELNKTKSKKKYSIAAILDKNFKQREITKLNGDYESIRLSFANLKSKEMKYSKAPSDVIQKYKLKIRELDLRYKEDMEELNIKILKLQKKGIKKLKEGKLKIKAPKNFN